jgi:hypothetical protein
MTFVGDILGIGLPDQYGRFLQHLAIDLVAITLLAYVIYYRRHHRRDLLLAFVCFNVGIFSVVTILMRADASLGTSLALGLGLFGALSIIRLRSEEIRYHEVAYFFSALAVGIVSAIDIGEVVFSVTLATLIVVTMYVMDRVQGNRPVNRVMLVLDEIYSDEIALRDELERRLGVTVVGVDIAELDYVRDITRLEARYLARTRLGRDLVQGAEAPLSVDR